MQPWQLVSASVVWKADLLLVLSSCPHFTRVTCTGDPDECTQADFKVAPMVSQHMLVSKYGMQELLDTGAAAGADQKQQMFFVRFLFLCAVKCRSSRLAEQTLQTITAKTSGHVSLFSPSSRMEPSFHSSVRTLFHSLCPRVHVVNRLSIEISVQGTEGEKKKI